MMTPLGFWLGVKKKKPSSLKTSPELEKYFKKNGVRDCDPKVLQKF